ncbi:hypothetical protein EJB05_29784, partial [Eragrostis curvula]
NFGKETTTVSMVAATAIVASVVSATLNVVANKLAPLVIKQYSSIVGVTKDLEELKDLVKEVNCLLLGVGHEAIGNDPPLDWLRKLKDVAYTVDDIVDEFQLKAEEHDAALAGGGGIVFNMSVKPKSFIFQCKAAKKVKNIKKKFAAIVKQRTDISAIVNSLPPGQPICHINSAVAVMSSLPIVNSQLVIGRDNEKKKIVSKLVDACEQKEIKVVSIIRLGGSGKTTLAKLVFNDDTIIESHFEVRGWVHVSQEFDVENKLIKKLFEAISTENSEGHSNQHMIKTISDKLSKNRFLLVLDDVWTENRLRWETFMEYVKDGAPGSKILLTTRNRNVAEAVESIHLLNLSFLSTTDSWQVFEQSFGMAVKDLDPEFLEVGKDIVNKCCGVPLAIKVLAGVLRVKKRIEQWHTIRENNLLNAEDKEHQVSTCLSLSYFNLPSYVKPCFTICSLFPKGHLIDKEQLIDQWIAHDMIFLEDGVNYLEHTGDDYFNYLVQMGFLQDVHENNDGRVKCRMHDLVHEFSRSILGDEISLAVPTETAKLTKVPRYFSLMEQKSHLPPKNTFEKARSMYVVLARGDAFILGKALKNAKHLRSFTVKSVKTKSALTAILQIKNLRYLNISRLKCKTFPGSISDIWGLEALHVSRSNLVKLPESIGKLQKLRAVHLSYCRRLESLPDSIGNCHMISSINLYFCEELTMLPDSISRNIRLRVLRLARTGIKRLPSSITILENLECLDLDRCSKLVELPEGIGNLKKLVVLNLQGCERLEAMPVGIGQLTQLRKLGLFAVRGDLNCPQISELENVSKIGGELTIRSIAHGMNLNDGQKACLKQKTNLQSLSLIWRNNVAVNPENEVAVLDGLEPPSGIRSLKVSGYAGPTCTQWMLQQASTGAAGFPRFQWLSKLKLSYLPNLKHLQGLVELPCLEKLVLTGMPALESISGGPFPSLMKLEMADMHRLGVVLMVSKGNLADEVQGGGVRQVRVGSLLSELFIFGCPRLQILPHLPFSLGHLKLYRSNEQLLQLPGPGEGATLSSSDAGLTLSSSDAGLTLSSSDAGLIFSNFSRLKKLQLKGIPEESYGSGCEWNLLQHLTELESLEIGDCNGLTELPESMRSLRSLRFLRIYNCSALRTLGVWLGELCCLQLLEIRSCRSLSSLISPSVQHLTSLQTLSCSENIALFQGPDLEWIGDLRSLRDLRIRGCNGLSSLPQSLLQLTSLEDLNISSCRDTCQLPDRLGESLLSLRILNITEMRSLRSVPPSLGNLSSLQELQLCLCSALHQLPECLGELRSLRKFRIRDLRRLTCLPQSLCRLTSLQELDIQGCIALHQLPESLGELCSLRTFQIGGLPGLTCLPQSMSRLTSLEQLLIGSCPGITSLPEWIKCLPSLKRLCIYICSSLESRCKIGKGKDWHLISHIPHLGRGAGWHLLEAPEYTTQIIFFWAPVLRLLAYADLKSIQGDYCRRCDMLNIHQTTCPAHAAGAIGVKHA